MNSIFQKKANASINNQATSPEEAKPLNVLDESSNNKKVVLLDLILESLLDPMQNSLGSALLGSGDVHSGRTGARLCFAELLRALPADQSKSRLSGTSLHTARLSFFSPESKASSPCSLISGPSVKSSASATPVVRGVRGDDAHFECASSPANNTPATLQLNIPLLRGLQRRFPWPQEQNSCCRAEMVTRVLQSWYESWEGRGDVGEQMGEKLWQTHSEKISKVSRVGGCRAEPLPFPFGTGHQAGQAWPERIPGDSAVENRPEICAGELTGAVEPSQLTWLIQTSQGIKLTEKEEEWSLEWIHTCPYFFLFAYGSLCSLPSRSDGETPIVYKKLF